MSEIPLVYQACSVPSWFQNLPPISGVRSVMSLRIPETLSLTPSGAESPPISVRTHPGLITMAVIPIVAQRPAEHGGGAFNCDQPLFGLGLGGRRANHANHFVDVRMCQQ